MEVNSRGKSAETGRPGSPRGEEGEAGARPRAHPDRPRVTARWGRGLRGRGGRGEAGERARLARPKSGRRRLRTRGPGGGVRGPGRRPFAGREGRPERTREWEKGQEVPYRHRATLPPHPLRSRRSAPTLGARPRRPTWPPRAQLKGGDQQPPPTPSQPRCPGAREGREPADERTKKARDSNPRKAAAALEAANKTAPAALRLRTRRSSQAPRRL